MIRVALAGAGWVSEHHLQAWATQRDRAQVVASADPRLDAAEARAGQFGVPHVFSSAEALLAAVPVDAIDIAAPREFHAPLCRLAARHGLAILCQKPLAPTLQEAEALVAELRNTRLMVHENWRFRPHYRTAREWLRAGEIGEVRSALMMLRTSGLLPDETGALPALVRQPMLATLDRMLVMEVLIHHIDTLRFLLGPLTLLSAELERNCPAIRGEDWAELRLRAANGAEVTVGGDFTASAAPAAQMDELHIAGTAGTILLEADQLTLQGRTQQNIKLDLAANYSASYRAAIAHFLDRLQDGREFETGARDNLETLRIVEAAYISGRSAIRRRARAGRKQASRDVEHVHLDAHPRVRAGYARNGQPHLRIVLAVDIDPAEPCEIEDRVKRRVPRLDDLRARRNRRVDDVVLGRVRVVGPVVLVVTAA
jgi:predicted dehydrogenase